MTYRQAFDRLGNPVYRRASAPIGPRIVQWASLVCTLILMALLYRP